MNLLAIMISFYKDHSYVQTRLELLHFWRRSTILINLVFLVDLTLNIIIVGIRKILMKKKHLLLEVLLQILCIVVFFKLFGGGLEEFSNGVGLAMTIYFARLIRIADFFTELQ